MPAKRSSPAALLALALLLLPATVVAQQTAPGGQAPAGEMGTFEEGLDALRTGRTGLARDIWTPLAERGDMAAQYSLGKLYEQGGGPVAQDLAQSVRWYRAAAAQNLPAAQNNLGLLHAQGRGVPKDQKRATELWLAAAAQDYPWAQYNLGLAYFKGQGVETDRREAVAWFRRAADNGLPEAQFIMGQLRREGLGVERDTAQALAWYRMAADQRHLEAGRMARRLEERGVEPKQPDPPEAEPVSLASKEVLPPAPVEEAAGVTPGDQAEPTPPEPAGESVGSGGPAEEPPAQTQSAETPSAETPRAAVPETEPERTAERPAEPAPAPVAAVPEPEVGEPAEPPAAVEAAAPVPEPAPSEPAETAALEPASADPAPRGAQPAPLGPPRYRLWLASSRSGEEARALWEEARGRHPALAEMAAVIGEARVSDKPMYRVLAGAFEALEAARAACGALRAERPDTFCAVRRDGAGGGS